MSQSKKLPQKEPTTNPFEFNFSMSDYAAFVCGFEPKNKNFLKTINREFVNKK